MTITIILLFTSFFLDGIFFSIITENTLVNPLCTLLSLVIVYPLLKQEKKNYFIISAILGFFYDICYGNMLFFHALVFLLFSYGIDQIFKKLSINILNSYLVGMLVMFLYRTLLALFFVLLRFANWDIEMFLNSIFSSILLNSIYLLIFYFIVKKIRKYLKKEKYKLLKVEKREQN